MFGPVAGRPMIRLERVALNRADFEIQMSAACPRRDPGGRRA
jgi:pyrrolidone-carboxylate peptidase